MLPPWGSHSTSSSWFHALQPGRGGVSMFEYQSKRVFNIKDQLAEAVLKSDHRRAVERSIGWEGSERANRLIRSLSIPSSQSWLLWWCSYWLRIDGFRNKPHCSIHPFSKMFYEAMTQIVTQGRGASQHGWAKGTSCGRVRPSLWYQAEPNCQKQQTSDLGFPGNGNVDTNSHEKLEPSTPKAFCAWSPTRTSGENKQWGEARGQCLWGSPYLKKGIKSWRDSQAGKDVRTQMNLGSCCNQLSSPWYWSTPIFGS